MKTTGQLTQYLKTTTLILLFIITIQSVTGQLIKTSHQWHKLDYKTDAVYGISWQFAMMLLQRMPPPEPVIVAIIDSGIDTTHVALRDILWSNPLEKGGDEDNNGLVGDYHGWNFLGNNRGEYIDQTSLEHLRMYFQMKQEWAGIDESTLTGKNRKAFKVWVEVRDKFIRDSTAQMEVKHMSMDIIASNDQVVCSLTGKSVYTIRDIAAIKGVGIEHQAALVEMKRVLSWDTTTTNVAYVNSIRDAVNADSTFSSDPSVIRRKVIGDRPDDLRDTCYGNNDLSCGMRAAHGTHVSGIIGGKSFHGSAAIGINPFVKIMSLRVVPSEGDEYDKDVALAIRYAVDHGAKVINMSFGKYFSAHPEWVNEALAYAAEMDVLVVKAAGNDHLEVDRFAFYPSAVTNRKKALENVITVGASGPKKEDLVASFSNYGNAVDLFAPGVNIISSLPNNLAEPRSGTSVASPVVAGIASILRAYFPSLTAVEVKIILMQSVRKIDFKVLQPGTARKVPFRSLCKSGGIVNLANAMQLAMSYQESK